MKKAMTIVYEVGNNLYVNITNKCPCSCTFCIRQNADGAYGSDSLWLEHEPTAEEIIDALKNADYKKYNEIVYCGYGEPTERIEVLAETATREEYLKVTRPKFGEKSYEAMQKFASDCKKYVKNVVFSVVDVIGDEQIKASQEMADKLGIKLRVRKYEK